MSYTPTNWASTDVVTATRMNALEQAVGEIDMSYTPNVWQDGDVLTASKMNALEQAVASGGGGGSSDFSTAQVTIVNNTSLDADARCVCITEDGLEQNFTSVSNSTINRNILLYSQLQEINMYFPTYGSENITVEVSGDITVDEVDLPYIYLNIRGNGTITLKE